MRMRYHQLGRGGSGCTEKPKEKTGQNDLNKIGSHAAQAQRSAREAAAGGWGGQRPRRGGTTAPGAGYWLSGQRGGGRTPPPGSARRWGGGWITPLLTDPPGRGQLPLPETSQSLFESLPTPSAGVGHFGQKWPKKTKDLVKNPKKNISLLAPLAPGGHF